MAYIDTAFLTAYATGRGVDLSAYTEVFLRVAIIIGEDYVDSLAPFKAVKTSPEQATEFPRTGLIVAGYRYADDEIPTEIKQATAEAAILHLNGEDLLAAQTAGVISEKVDVIQINYSGTTSAGQKVFPRIVSLVRPFRRAGELEISR